MPNSPDITTNIAAVRGVLKKNVPLAPYTWFRVGGRAEYFFMPKDEADLALFLSALPQEIPVTILGVASNTLIRDGGVKGVVIRLGPAFGQINILDESRIEVGTACLDNVFAKKAAKAGIAGFEFFASIPGTIGGALRMNAGCYGAETKDVVENIIAIDRRGRRIVLSVDDMEYSYRHCGVADGLIFTSAVFKGSPASPEVILAKMQAYEKQREKTQPLREKTGGSTFKNPDPKLAEGKSAWQLIDEAGGRGFKIGGAQMSPKHCNFMINTGDATAKDLEDLGEAIRAKVKAHFGIELEWEVRRIGEML